MKRTVFLWLCFVCLPLVASEQGETNKFQKDDIVEITYGTKKNVKGFIACTALEAWREVSINQNDSFSACLCVAMSQKIPIIAEYILQIIPKHVWLQAVKHSSDKRGGEILNNYLRFNSIEDVYCIDTEKNEQCLAHKSWLKIYEKKSE